MRRHSTGLHLLIVACAAPAAINLPAGQSSGASMAGALALVGVLTYTGQR